MKKRRVLLIGPLPPPIGGDTILTLTVLKSGYWDDGGIERECIDTSPGDKVRVVDERISLRDLSRAAGILFQVIGKLPRARAVLLWANCRFICTLGLPIIMLSAMARRPIVIKPFGALLAERITGFHPGRKRVTVFLLNKSKYLLPETRRLAGELASAGIDPERIVPFPNFLPDASLRAAYRKKRFGGRSVFVGQIKREKGVFEIIGALAGHDEFTCDFHGPILDRDRDAFLKEISRNGNCRYAGVIPPDDVIEVISRYDALLLPSYHSGEGHPAVILQAFAAGVPVVASDWKSIPELVEDGVRGILVPARSADSVRGALERLASDEKLYDSIAANAFDFVKAYSEKALVKDLLMAKVSELL